MAKLLIVEDDATLGMTLRLALGAQGHEVQVAPTLARARAFLAAQAPDLILLDLGLPDGDGLDLVKDLRKARVVLPILALTARTTLADRVDGLRHGADDYVTKPFDPDELAARMRALRRRAAGRGQALLQHGDLLVDPAARTVQRGGVPLALSGREFAVLLLLLEASPRVLSRAQIEASLYTWDGALESNAIEVHVHHLRKKLGAGLIQTVRGVGYLLPRELPA
jgi:two-component system OmpR family response regulator/two-component system response regulator QseB